MTIRNSLWWISASVSLFVLSACFEVTSVKTVPTPQGGPPGQAHPTGLHYPLGTYSFFIGTAISPLDPTINGGGSATFSAIPSLPAGLEIDPTTGVIDGIPVALTSPTEYEIRASYPGGFVSVTLSLSVIAPAQLSFSGGSNQDFLAVQIGNPANKTVVLTNTGGAAASNISYDASQLPSTITILPSGTTCGNALASRQNCNLVVQFSPIWANADSGCVKIHFFDGLTNQSPNLCFSGVGAEPADLSFGVTSIDFGTIYKGAYHEQTVTVTNNGLVNATAITASFSIADPQFAFSGGSYPGTGGTCGSILAAGANCTLVLRFTSSGVGDAQNLFRLSFTSGGSHPVANLNLSAYGSGPGVWDRSFGSGLVTLTVPGGRVVTITDLAEQTDGKILLFGTAGSNTVPAPFCVGEFWFVQRFLTDGTLDASFGTQGTVQLAPIHSGQRCNATSGKMILQGSSILLTGMTNLISMGAARLSLSGAQDATYGASGWAQVSGVVDSLSSTRATMAANGDLLVAGTKRIANGSSLVVAAFKSDGSLDLPYGAQGESIWSSTTNWGSPAATPRIAGFVTLTDGSTVALINLTLVKLTSSGAMVATFGSNDGVIDSPDPTLPSYLGTAMAMQSDGKIVTMSASGLKRWSSVDGSLDTNFGTNGTASFAGQISQLVSLPSGNLIALGYNTFKRVFSDGTTDPSFLQQLDVQLTGALAVQSDGKILVANYYPWAYLARVYP